jgi:hypothetical protein
MGGAAGGHAGAELCLVEDFAAFALGDALFEVGVESGAAGEGVFALGFDEVEGVGDEVGGFAITADGELLLEELFGGGIEGERHGESIPLAGVVGGPDFVGEMGTLTPLIRKVRG